MKKTVAMIMTAVLCFSGCAASAEVGQGDAAMVEKQKLSEELPVPKMPGGDPELPPAVPQVPAGDRPNELVIALEGEDGFINEAAELYMAAHDDVKITVRQVETENNRDKYTQTVSTELVSGKGADIYDGSFLSYYMFADSGMLADLDEFIGEDLKNGNYSTALMDSLLYNGKRYTVPLSYNFEGYQMDPKVAKAYGVAIPEGNITLKELEAISEQLPKDGSVMLIGDSGNGPMSDSSLAYELLGNSISDYVDFEGKKADFAGGRFDTLIETVSQISDAQQIVRTADTAGGADTGNTEFLINPYSLYSPMMSHKGTVDLKGAFLLTNDDGSAGFSCTSFLPIVNNASDQKALAGDFIRFLLSDEAQSLPSLLFCPVNKNSIAEVSRLSYEDTKAGGYLPEGFTEEALQSNIEIYNALSEDLGVYKDIERTVRNMILDELLLLFSGEKTAAQAAEQLQTAVGLYLSE